MLAMDDKAVQKLPMFPKAGTVFLYKCKWVEERDNYKATAGTKPTASARSDRTAGRKTCSSGSPTF